MYTFELKLSTTILLALYSGIVLAGAQEGKSTSGCEAPEYFGNVFLYGLSRGGMMAFLALKNGVAVNAVAVVGAVIDLEASIKVNPHVIRVARQLIPDYESRGVEIMRDRSVIHWVEKINTPLLIIHGSNDQEIPASQALALAISLQEFKKTYELIIYADDNHETMKNREDRNRRIVSWFKRYMK